MVYLKNDLEQYKFRWKNATDKYVKTYPDKKVNGDSTQNDRAYDTILKVLNDVALFQANLKGDIANSTNRIDKADKHIQRTKKKFFDKKIELVSALGENTAAKPFKIDKYDENSESYINIVAYFIAIFSTSFFIYKQIKQ